MTFDPIAVNFVHGNELNVKSWHHLVDGRCNMVRTITSCERVIMQCRPLRGKNDALSCAPYFPFLSPFVSSLMQQRAKHVTFSVELEPLFSRLLQKCVSAVRPTVLIFHSVNTRLSTHVCFLFNIFIKLRYLPLVLIQSVIIPLVKSKSGNLSDVNNYRAIAISTAMSKLLESVISASVFSSSEIAKYQFGFKSEHSTRICNKKAMLSQGNRAMPL